MSEAAPGPGWWLASDGEWYPPSEADRPPAPGWWLAADGKWYPPKEADTPPGPGWWLASDGKWYAPEERTGGAGSSSESTSTTAPKGRSRRPARSKTKNAGTRGGRRRAAKAEPAAEPVEQPADRTPAPQPPTPARPAAAAPSAAPPAAAHDRIRPNANEGVSPLDQIERRNEASRADAKVLAAKRAQAASRALGGVQSMIAAELAARKIDDVFASPSPRPAAPPSAPAAVTQPAVVEPAVEEPTSEQPRPSAPEDGSDDVSPLLEVKGSTGSAELDHVGDRLAIFVDRVELRDRLDRVRQSIVGDDIVDVVVQMRSTDAVLTIESVRGPGITAKGLRPEQAEEARKLIMTKTRPARMAKGNGTHSAKQSAAPRPTTTKPSAPIKAAGPKLDVADLRGKLADLRRAGLLTEDEYVLKLELLAQLARAQAFSRSTR